MWKVLEVAYLGNSETASINSDVAVVYIVANAGFGAVAILHIGTSCRSPSCVPFQGYSSSAPTTIIVTQGDML